VTSRPQAKARRALAAQIAAASRPARRGRRAAPPSITAPIAPSQGGMGLGFFIARTLLERTGAKVSVGSGDGEKGQPKGARVSIRWPRQALEAPVSAMESGGT
jgi:two-component system sensor histidine kinase RegB